MKMRPDDWKVIPIFPRQLEKVMQDWSLVSRQNLPVKKFVEQIIFCNTDVAWCSYKGTLIVICSDSAPWIHS